MNISTTFNVGDLVCPIVGPYIGSISCVTGIDVSLSVGKLTSITYTVSFQMMAATQVYHDVELTHATPPPVPVFAGQAIQGLANQQLPLKLFSYQQRSAQALEKEFLDMLGVELCDCGATKHGFASHVRGCPAGGS